MVSPNPEPAGNAASSSKRKESPGSSDKKQRDGDRVSRPKVPDLDLTYFVTSHVNVIHETQAAINKSKANHRKQAFQKLPRDQRRRTMGHNDNSAKKKHFKRTRKAMSGASGAKPKSRGKKKTTENQSKVDKSSLSQDELSEDDPSVKFPEPLERQKKGWLPTHMWHAKRAHMEKRWGFKLPKSPTAKVYRITHRALREAGAVCWDTSYTATIRMHGDGMAVVKLLDLNLGRDKQVVKGSRQMLHGWAVFAGQVAAVFNPGPSPASSQREVFLRVHPAAFDRVWKDIAAEIKQGGHNVDLQDLRYDIGSIEIAGPASSEVLQGILRPHRKEGVGQEWHADCFRSMGCDTAAPVNAVLAFSIQDPRLAPAEEPYQEPDLDDNMTLKHAKQMALWPADMVAEPTAIFDHAARRVVHPGRLQDKEIAQRRKLQDQEMPGNKTLKPGPDDQPFPIMLIASGDATWTVLAMAECIRDLWSVAMRYPLSTGGNPRFGGLIEHQQMKFEQCLPWFPADYPAATEGIDWELEQRKLNKECWEKTPSGKRMNGDSLDLGAGRKGEIGSQFACDWEFLFGIATVSNVDGDNQGDASASAATHPLHQLSYIPSCGFLAMLDDGLMPVLSFPPYPITSVTITMLGGGVPERGSRVYRLPAPKKVKASKKGVVPSTKPSGNTKPGFLPVDLRQQWMALANSHWESAKNAGKGKEKGKGAAPALSGDTFTRARERARERALAKELLTASLPYPPPKLNQTDFEGRPLCPGKDDLVGFVTSGGFNLAKGCGTGIAGLHCEKVIEGVRRAKLVPDRMRARLCIVRNVGQSFGYLAMLESKTW